VASLALTLQILHEALEIDQRPLGKGQNFRAELGWLHTARETLEKRHSEELLELVEEFGRARLSQMHRVRCTVQIALLAERYEQSELAEP
jgi:hypothetical protein